MNCIEKQIAPDGTAKYLWQLSDGGTIEGLTFSYRGQQTICVSTQVGCAVKCPFCETGRQGLQRNLTAEEITGQVVAALNDSAAGGERRFDIVTISGMGEPLLNFDHVAEAIRVMRRDGLSREISVTTAGIVPNIYKLAHTNVTRLSISLHATTDELRNRLVPVNRKYPIAALLEAARYFYSQVRQRVRATYLMLDQLNDTDDDLERMMQLLDRDIFRVRLREWNAIGDTQYARSGRSAYFERRLVEEGFDAYVSRNVGVDIDGGCGQLRSRYLLAGIGIASSDPLTVHECDEPPATAVQKSGHADAVLADAVLKEI
jgi:23S rRNA (adenine2503-C2)-methyltransferase